MSKKEQIKTDDTKDASAMTTEAQEASAVVDNSKVSTKKKIKYEKPTIVELDSLEEFDPSATHEDYSEDDKFDDEDDID